MESACAGDKLFVLHDGLVCRLHGGNEVTLVVPDIDDLRSDLLTLHYNSPMAGHLGLYRMMWVLAKRYCGKACIMIVDDMYMLVGCVRLLKYQLRSRQGCYSRYMFWTTYSKSVR